MRRFCIGVVLIWSLVPHPAWAQTSSANLSGTVKDTSGGVLPGVAVTARNIATNDTRTATTASDGLYRLTNLSRGTYEVTAELEGFKPIKQSNILLTSGDSVRVDFGLEIGTVAETVTVEGRAALVNIEEGRVSYLVDEKRVAELPLNGRNAMQLMELQPGSAANPASAVLGGSAGGNTAFVNGQRNRANNFMLDGTDNNDQFTAGRVAINPNVDVIQEFRVSTNNFSAEFGRNSASVVNVVTKGGTNQFHGTLYEFIRDDSLDAKSILATKKDPLKFNQFGATNGGPIVKNKLFYFAAYEGLRLTRGTTLVRTVETPEFRQMVARLYPNSIANLLFSKFPSPNPTSNIRDTGRPVTGLQTESVANNPSVVTNPNFVATSATLYRNVLQSTPDGIPDTGTANIPVSEKTNANQFSVRLDLDLSQTQRLFGRFIRDTNVADDLQSIPRNVGFNQPVDQIGNNLTLNHTWILSNSVVNEARFGYAKRDRTLGTIEANEGVPNIAFDDGLVSFGVFSTNPAMFVQKTFHWVDTVTISKGHHSFKTGGEYRYIQDNSDFAVRRGGYNFFNVFDFAQDEVARVSIMGIDPRIGMIAPNVRNFRFHEFGVFLQDDWRIRPNLTINAGLRYEWFGRPSEINNLLTNMIPGPGNNIFQQVATATVGQVDQVVPNDFNNFGPRIGVSWDPKGNNRMAVRAGYGLMYERLFNNSITNIRFNPPFYSFAVANPTQVASHAGIPIAYGPYDANGKPRNQAPTIEGNNVNVGVTQGLGIKGNIIGWNPAFGTSQQSLRVPDPNGSDAYTHNWFAGVQAQLIWNLVLEANYVGNVGRNLGRLVDYNTITGDLFDGKLDRLNPGFGGINYRAMVARSSYHAGQFQLNKRLSKGFSGQVSYTIGKAMDSGSDVQIAGFPVDAYNLDLEYAPADFDVRHRLVANWLWEIPFLKNATGLTGALLGGWQINGVVQWQTGYPFSVTTGAAYPTGDYNGDGVNNDRPNLPSFGTKPPATDQNAYLNGLFKASDFPRPAVIGNLPRNAYRGPHYKSMDFSLFKDFRLPFGSATKLQFRAEAFNLLNNVNLDRPNGNLAQATFGRSVRSFAAREIQFALKLIF